MRWSFFVWIVLGAAVLATVFWHVPQNFRDDRSDIRAHLLWPDACEQAFESTADASHELGVHYFELGEGRRLVQVSCATGDYQPSFLYFLEKEFNKPVLLQFPKYEDAYVWGIPEFDRSAQRLSILVRFSGVSPCSERRQYSFDSGAPVLNSSEPLCTEGEK